MQYVQNVSLAPVSASERRRPVLRWRFAAAAETLLSQGIGIYHHYFKAAG